MKEKAFLWEKHETKNRIYERREEHRRGKWLMKKLRKTGHISHPIRWHMTVGSCQNAMTNSTKQKKICEISDKNIRNWFLKIILKIQNGHKKFHIFSLTFLLLHLQTWLSLPFERIAYHDVHPRNVMNNYRSHTTTTTLGPKKDRQTCFCLMWLRRAELRGNCQQLLAVCHFEFCQGTKQQTRNEKKCATKS